MSELQQVEDLFHRARALDAADRGAYLDAACAEDLGLRREVESLLLHSDSATTAVSLPAIDSDTQLVDRGPVSEGPGSRIGAYKILQQIGEGGFGVVYMAEQEHPVRRKVAIKIIKLGMDTKQVIARFEAERQALALMDHPNIARVLDAGATETGRPYFVMELVRGIPITQYCDEQRLSTTDRLELFLHVCHAIAHAHQKGIIHRDIKPSNVMVTLHDDVPVPKVIDFGIAKATSQRLTERTLFTEFRQFVGTPEYMSPDQADISGLDIDTRTDIYSLGVLLFELLTGTTPLDSHTLRSQGYADIQRIIRESEPPLPSTRVNMLGRRVAPRPTTDNGDGAGSTTSEASSLAAIAKRRRIEPHGLTRMLRGDLDWIVMKAMEKDRTRRYQTANELAADIKRHLNDEAVLAGPPSTVYAIRKFMRRHRFGVTVAGVVAGALVVGLSVASIGFYRANREAAHSKAVSEFLQADIIALDEERRDELTLDEVVERGRELFGDDHAIVGTLLSSRASALAAEGRSDEAIEAQEEALEFLKEAHGARDPQVAVAIGRLAELHEDRRDAVEAERLYREALELTRAQFGDKSRQTAEALERLTSLIVETSPFAGTDDTADLYKQTVAAFEASMGPEAPETVRQLCEMTCWMHNAGRLDDAAAYLPVAYERAKAVLEPNDMTRFTTVNCLAQMTLTAGRYVEAAPYLEELIVLARSLWGPSSVVELILHHQLVLVFNQAQREGDVPAVMREIVAIRATESVEPNPIAYQLGLASIPMVEDWLEENPEKARLYILSLWRDVEAVTPEGSEQRMNIMAMLAKWLSDEGHHEDALPRLEVAVGLLRSAGEEEEKGLASALVHQAQSLVAVGRAEEGESVARECLGIRVRVLDEEDWLIESARSVLGETIAAQGRWSDAEPLVVRAYETAKASGKASEGTLEDMRLRVVRLYEAWGRPEDAARFAAGGSG